MSVALKTLLFQGDGSVGILTFVSIGINIGSVAISPISNGFSCEFNGCSDEW